MYIRHVLRLGNIGLQKHCANMPHVGCNCPHMRYTNVPNLDILGTGPNMSQDEGVTESRCSFCAVVGAGDSRNCHRTAIVPETSVTKSSCHCNVGLFAKLVPILARNSLGAAVQAGLLGTHVPFEQVMIGGMV